MEVAQTIQSAYQKNLENLEKVHADARKNQLANFKEQNDRIAATQAEHDAMAAQKVKDFIKGRNQELDNIRQSELKETNKNAEALRDTFTKKLDDVRSSYEQSKRDIASESASNVQRIELDAKKRSLESAKNYQNTLDELDKKYDALYEQERVENVRGRKDLAKDYSLQLNSERQKLQNEKKSLITNQQKRLDQIQDEFTHQNNTKQQIHDQQLETIKKNHKRSEASIEKHYSNSFDGEKEKSDLRDILQKQEHLAEIKKREDEFRQEKRRMNEQFGVSIKGLKDVDLSANDRLKDTYEQRLRSQQIAAEKDLMIAKAPIDILSQKAKQDSIERSREFNKEKQKIITGYEEGLLKTRQNSDSAIENLSSEFRQNLNTQASAANDRFFEQEVDNKKNITTLKKQFTDTLVDLTERNTKEQDEMRDSFKREKTSFIETTRKNHADDLHKLRKDLNKGFGKGTEAYESQLAQQRIDQERLVSQYEKKMESYKASAAKELADRNEAEKERTEELKKNFANILEQKNEDTELKIFAVKQQFDAETLRTKNYHTSQLNTVVDKYEKQLKLVKAESEKNAKQHIDMLQNENLRLKKEHLNEIANMKAQYETKMEKLKLATAEARRIAEVRQENS